LEKQFVGMVQDLRSSLTCVRDFHLLDGSPHEDWLSPQNYEALLAAPAPYRADIMDFDENSLAELFYTSGTSANPKGVMLTHRNVYLHAMTVCVTFQVKAESVELHTIPLFHANGWGVAHW